MPLHTSAPSARRFYTLFYQWGLLSHPKNHHARSCATIYRVPRTGQAVRGLRSLSSTPNPNASNRRRLDTVETTETRISVGEEPARSASAKSTTYPSPSEQELASAAEPQSLRTLKGRNSKDRHSASFWIPYSLGRHESFRQFYINVRRVVETGRWKFEAKSKYRSEALSDKNKHVVVEIEGTAAELQEVRLLINSNLFPYALSELGLPSRKLETIPSGDKRQRWVYAPKDGTRSLDNEPNADNLLSMPPDADQFLADKHSSLPGNEGKKSKGISPTAPVPSLSSHLKDVCRTLTSPVVVITARAPTMDSSVSPAHMCRAVTVSSFSVVALHPKPSITFSLHRRSRTLTAIKENGQVTVHILAANSAGARLADVFARRREIPAEPFLNGEVGQFELETSNTSPPRLLGTWSQHFSSNCQVAVIARLNCLMDITSNHKVGDHELLLGRVLSVETLNEKGEVVSSENTKLMPALSYGERAYRLMGDEVGLQSPEENSSVPVSSKQVEGLQKVEDAGGDSLQSDIEHFLEGISQPNKAIADPDNPINSQAQVSAQETTTHKDFEQETIDANVQSAFRPWGLPPLDQARTFSTMTRQRSLRTYPTGQSQKTLGQHRQYSIIGVTCTSNQMVTNFSTRLSHTIAQLSGTLPSKPSITEQEEKASRAKKELAIWSPSPAHHMRRLRTLQRDIDNATLALETAEADGLDAVDCTRLDTKIYDAQREITKILARNAATELATLLDTWGGGDSGRPKCPDRFDPNDIDMLLRQAGTPTPSEWFVERLNLLEQQVEEGLAALMEEAKDLRSNLDAGAIDIVAFNKRKAVLTAEHEHLDTQSRRLRSSVEEEQDWEDDDL